MENIGMCTICGGYFTLDATVSFGENTTFSGVSHDSVICEECNKLSHYEQRKLYLLNCLVEKKPHGYWREVGGIQKSLESIAEQLTTVLNAYSVSAERSSMNSGEE